MIVALRGAGCRRSGARLSLCKARIILSSRASGTAVTSQSFEKYF
jgi:hypothetical protein